MYEYDTLYVTNHSSYQFLGVDYFSMVDPSNSFLYPTYVLYSYSTLYVNTLSYNIIGLGLR